MERQFSLPHQKSEPVPLTSPISFPTPPDCDVRILDQENPTARDLVNLFDKLHDHTNHEYGFNLQWTLRIEHITYCAQRIINRVDENSRPAYQLFKAAGIKVKWPNILMRMVYAIWRTRRAQLYILREKVKLQQEKSKEAEAAADIKIAELDALKAKEYNAAKATELKLLTLKRKIAKEEFFSENTTAITSFYTSIQERIAENRNHDFTNNLITKYNALLDAGEHNLKKADWKKLEYILLSKGK